MTENSKKPCLRFKGFTETWKQRKAKEICNIATGKSNTQDQKDDGKYPFYIRSDVPVRSDKYLYDCEAVITIGDGNIGKVFHYVKGKFDLHQRCYKMTDFRDIYGKYFYYFFSTRFYDRAIKMTAKATVDSVRMEMISEMNILFPKSLSEQKSISKLFSTLDNLITLHQRKYDKFVAIKKALLEKMFPCDGKNIPEIRFKGFTETWKQRKLGDFGKCKSGVGFPDSQQGGQTGIPFFKVSDMNTEGNEKIMCISNNYVTEQQITNNSWNVIKSPAVFFAKVGAAVMLNRKRLILSDFLLDNNTMTYPINIENFDTDFCYTLFETIDLPSLVQVGALPSYNANQVDNIEVTIPKFSEQTKIGTMFNNLDNLITLHQRQLEKLKNIKTALLEKMFV